jgi:hypothetical protein
VCQNPLAGKAAADFKPLIDCSLELGASLTKAMLGASPVGDAPRDQTRSHPEGRKPANLSVRQP